MYRLPAHLPVPGQLGYGSPLAEHRHNGLVPLSATLNCFIRGSVKHQPNTFCRASAEVAQFQRAGDEIRTRDHLLGRQALYQLSYSRVVAYCSGRPTE